MALIHVFNNFSDKKTTYTFCGKIRDNINLDWNNTVVLKGGHAITADYEVRPNDIIYIRETPGAGVALAAGIFGGLLLLEGAVYYGVKLYQDNQRTQKALESAQKAAKAASEQSNRLPYVRGARNQPATGQTFPYVIGQTYYAPVSLCPGYYTIEGAAGEKQYYNVVLESGYNNILIKQIKLGDTIIKQFSDTAPQSGVFSWDAGTYYDENNIIEIQQSAEFETSVFNKKIALTELNKEIPHQHLPDDATPADIEQITEEWEAGVVQQLATNPKAVEIIALFDGLQKYDTDNGAWKNATITLRPQWTNNPDDAEPTWHDFTTGFIQNGAANNTFDYNTKKQMRFIARQEFTAAQAYNKKISIRVQRTTPKAASNARDTVYLMAVQTECYDAKKSSNTSLITAKPLEDRERAQCCRIGIRVTANTNTTGNLDAFSVLEAGQAAEWNGTAWTAKTSTRNLASWVREILLSDKHRPSQYQATELDDATWGAWFNYCRDMGFYADGVITKGTKKETILATLCRNGNAALVYNPMTGKIEVAIDNGRDYSVALLNSDTIQSISTTKEFKRKATGKKVTYINAAAGYDIDSVIFMEDGEAYDPATDTLTTTALEYVTSYEHAFKIAWRQMAEEKAQPRTVTVKVGPEAAYYPIYSCVELQHKSLKIGLAHAQIKALTWQSGLLKKIILEGPVQFPATGNCGVLVNCISDTGRGLLAVKVAGTGKTDTLDVLDTIKTSDATKPTAGNFLSFGKLDNDGNFSTVTKTMKIINAEETDSGYTLTLVDYNAALYNYGPLPEYKSNITSIPAGTGQTIESQREYVEPAELEAAAQAAAGAAAGGAVQAAVDTITNGYRFTNIYNVRPVSETLEEIVAKMDDDARNVSASISISEEEILLQVENLDEQQRAFIDITKDQILQQVDDMAQELTGLISVQAGAVTAMVQGGAAAGQMSLSLNLPVTITAETRAKFVTASSEAETAAVYALVENTDYYGIKPTATTEEIQMLWNKAISAGLLASQIILNADQLNLAGKTIFTSSKTEAVANAAQAAAESTAETNRTALINAISQSTAQGETVIDGGYLKTALIDVENILTKKIFIKENGVICSSNYNGTIDSNGNITEYGTRGFAMDHNGKSDFVDVNITGTIYGTSGRFSAGIGNDETLDVYTPGKTAFKGIYKKNNNMSLVFVYKEYLPRNITSILGVFVICRLYNNVEIVATIQKDSALVIGTEDIDGFYYPTFTIQYTDISNYEILGMTQLILK